MHISHSHLILPLGYGVPASCRDADSDDENEKDAALLHETVSVDWLRKQTGAVLTVLRP